MRARPPRRRPPAARCVPSIARKSLRARPTSMRGVDACRVEQKPKTTPGAPFGLWPRLSGLPASGRGGQAFRPLAARVGVFSGARLAPSASGRAFGFRMGAGGTPSHAAALMFERAGTAARVSRTWATGPACRVSSGARVARSRRARACRVFGGARLAPSRHARDCKAFRPLAALVRPFDGGGGGFHHSAGKPSSKERGSYLTNEGKSIERVTSHPAGTIEIDEKNERRKGKHRRDDRRLLSSAEADNNSARLIHLFDRRNQQTTPLPILT